MTHKHTPISKRLYSYNPSNYCGVLMTEKVMKKLANVTAKFEVEVRRILTENIGDLYSYNWSLAYPNGAQTSVVFGDSDGVAERIAMFKARQPKYEPEVWLGKAFSDFSKEVISQIEAESKHAE